MNPTRSNRNVLLFVVWLIVGTALTESSPAAETDEFGSQLHDAAERGDLPAVQALIAQGDPVNAGAGPYRFTPLMGAAAGGHLDVTSYLIAHGANLDQQDSQGSTALLHVCDQNQTECALALLKAGANPNIGSHFNRFPLMYAAQKGNDAIVSALIAAKADLNASCNMGSAIIWAIDANHLSTVKLFLDSGVDPLKAPVGNPAPYKMHSTVLGEAAYVANIEMIDLLISKGCDVNALAADGNTPLIAAACSDSKDAVAAIGHLILKGAKIDAQNQAGMTALYKAINDKHREIVQTLLDNHANLELKDSKGFTPLIEACFMREYDIASDLISHGANVNATDNQGETALTRAGNVGESTFVQLLKDHGATRTDLHIIPANEPAQTLLPAQAWALAVSAVYTQRDSLSHNRLGGSDRPQRAGDARDMLLKWWSIKNRTDLLKEIDDLQHHGHHEQYQIEGIDLLMMSNDQYQQVLSAHPEHAAQIKAAKSSFETWNTRSGLAWDLCRAANLVNYAYAAHYIKEDEAWLLLMPIARQVQQNFSSWQEMSDNFIDGRHIWDVEQSSYMDNCSALLLNPHDPNSPWNSNPWKTDLSAN